MKEALLSRNNPMRFLLVISLLLCSSTFVNTQYGTNACSWKDPVSGNQYDFTPLRRDENNPWKFKQTSGMFSYIFNINICADHAKSCHM